jgi:type VI secretion system protein ImpA
MPRIDFTALADPLSENDPCGPDLDRRGDEDYLNFVTIAEGLLPAEYFTDGAPFDAAKIDVDGQIARLAPLLKRTRDVRLLVLLARFLVLDRDLAGFAATLETISQLLEAYWEKVHPSAEAGSFAMRAAAVTTLNAPTVFFPLQFIPLCEDRRLGAITLRAHLCTTGVAKPREGEPARTSSEILEALRQCDSNQFAATRDLIARLAAALKQIDSIFAEHCGIAKTPHLDKITATVAAMAALMDEAAGIETEEQAPGWIGQTGVFGLIKNAFAAGKALEAAIEYFRSWEPSSPVLPLIAQARELQGKTFVEVMQLLLPDRTRDAAYAIGDQKVFALPVERLASVMPAIENYGLEEPTVDSTPERFPPSGEPLAEQAGSGEADSAVALPEPAVDEGADIVPTNDPSEDQAATPSASIILAAQSKAATAANPLLFAPTTRKEAILLLDEAARYLRVAEPSSPIPWLIDRAKALADRDFISVLISVLPEDALREASAKR